MANIFVVFSKVIHEGYEDDFIVIDEATFSTISNPRNTFFSVNIFIGLLEGDVDSLTKSLIDIIVSQIKENENRENFIIIVPVNEVQFEHFKDRKLFLKNQHNLEKEIFATTKLNDLNVKFHKEDDFVRIIGKEKLFICKAFGYPDVTFPYPKEEIKQITEKPELILSLYNSA